MNHWQNTGIEIPWLQIATVLISAVAIVVNAQVITRSMTKQLNEERRTALEVSHKQMIRKEYFEIISIIEKISDDTKRVFDASLGSKAAFTRTQFQNSTGQNMQERVEAVEIKAVLYGSSQLYILMKEWSTKIDAVFDAYEEFQIKAANSPTPVILIIRPKEIQITENDLMAVRTKIINQARTEFGIEELKP